MLSNSPCINDMGKHPNILAFPVLFLVFLVKPVFDYIGKVAVITRWTRWWIALNNLKFVMCRLTTEKLEEIDVNLILFHLRSNVMLKMSRSCTGAARLERLDVY